MKKADNLIYLHLLKLFDFAVQFEAVRGLIVNNCGVIGIVRHRPIHYGSICECQLHYPACYRRLQLDNVTIDLRSLETTFTLEYRV